MSSEELPVTEDADMADCDGDKVVTMMDVLQEQQDFEEDANAVLGASDEKNCTFSKGYIKRQALYACLTCCPDAKTDPTKRAGVCLACSLACHENHELVELYTKRNFCCDCGNSKFNSNPCQFTSNKPELNENNSYNQNFSGLYCICHRPYPDPEATFEDEMIQCIICEDWLHASHLEAKLPPNEQYSEMICKGCMEKNEFLYDYSDLAINTEDVDVTTLNEKVNGLSNGDSETNGLEQNISKENGDVDMDAVATKDADEEKKLETANETESQNNNTSDDKTEQEPTNNSDHTQMEVEEKGSEQEVNEPIQAENNGNSDSVEATKYDNSADNDTAEKDINDSKEGATDVVAADENSVESKPAESEDDKATNEQNSILEDKVDDKTYENNISDEKVEKTTAGDNAEPSQTGDGTTEVTKDEDKSTLQSENQSNEELDNTGIEKDDLMESIDRIINGDDESSKEQVVATPDSGQEKSEEKTDEAKSNTDDIENIVGNENKVVEMNGDKTDVNQPKPDEDEMNADKTDEYQPEPEDEMNVDKIDENQPKPDEDEMNGDKTDENQPKSDEDMEANIPNSVDSSKPKEAEVESSKEKKRKLDDETVELSCPKKSKLDSCKRPNGQKKHHKGATFWPSSFREKLCTCNECLTMYKDLSVLFLIDLEDTVSAYETIGKEKNGGRSSQYEIGLQALSSLGRVQQINALTEYNKMRDKLLDFLKSFKDRKEIVKEEDIKAFFAGMKPKREPDGVYFCR